MYYEFIVYFFSFFGKYCLLIKFSKVVFIFTNISAYNHNIIIYLELTNILNLFTDHHYSSHTVSSMLEFFLLVNIHSTGEDPQVITT